MAETVTIFEAMTDIENWKPVVGYEGLYEVSDLGNVRSIDRFIPTSNGLLQFWKGKPIRPSWVGRKKCQHLGVRLTDSGRKRNNHKVHLLVLEAFVCSRPEGMQGCHYDDNRANNRLSNLRWDTPAGNQRDLRRNGLNPQVNKTKCPKGHEYDQENTYIDPKGSRICRECTREAVRLYRANKKPLTRESA